jgi:hypothetical protein
MKTIFSAQKVNALKHPVYVRVYEECGRIVYVQHNSRREREYYERNAPSLYRVNVYPRQRTGEI